MASERHNSQWAMREKMAFERLHNEQWHNINRYASTVSIILVYITKQTRHSSVNAAWESFPAPLIFDGVGSTAAAVCVQQAGDAVSVIARTASPLQAGGRVRGHETVVAVHCIDSRQCDAGCWVRSAKNSKGRKSPGSKTHVLYIQAHSKPLFSLPWI